jgi:hypothetical protein
MATDGVWDVLTNEQVRLGMQDQASTPTLCRLQLPAALTWVAGEQGCVRMQ